MYISEDELPGFIQELARALVDEIISRLGGAEGSPR